MPKAELNHRQGGCPTNDSAEGDHDFSGLINLQICGTKFLWDWYLTPESTFTETGLSTATPLHIAAAFGEVGIGTLLINSGASVDSVDARLWTPLHCAAYRGEVNMVEMLIKSGANTNAMNNKLRTPSMKAIGQSEDAPKTITALVKGGADLTLTDTWGYTTLLCATSARNWDTVIFLIHNFQCCDIAGTTLQGQSVLGLLLYLPLPRCLRPFLLNLGPNPSVYEPGRANVLSAMVGNNSPVFMKRLLRRLPKDLIPLLLTHRALTTGAPLYTAAIFSADKVIDMLIDAGAQLDLEGGDHGTPLMGACAMGRLTIVSMLVARGAKTSYVKDGEVIDALSAAKYHPKVRAWLLVGRFTGLRLITNGKNCS